MNKELTKENSEPLIASEARKISHESIQEKRSKVYKLIHNRVLAASNNGCFECKVYPQPNMTLNDIYKVGAILGYKVELASSVKSGHLEDPYVRLVW